MSATLNYCPIHWPRAIILLDMNAFFASIEQRDFPELRGQPVAITNGLQGSCIITCSYEARHYGIHTGMRLREAKQRCAHLIQRPTRPLVYSATSCQIMQALADICPDIEVFSVDEAFIDATPCQLLYGNPVRIAKLLKQAVFNCSGLLCSVGISGDKTTAKYAAKLQKPDGFTIIPPWESRQRLAKVPVTELCGIAKGIGDFLAAHQVFYCGDMAQLPISVLAQRFGNLGRRIWHMCQGSDPAPLQYQIKAPKSLGHGKIMPPNTRDKNSILTYLQHMSYKVAVRLRQHQLTARRFWIGLRAQQGWLGEKCALAHPSKDERDIFKLACQVLAKHWQGEGLFQVQITALDPAPKALQADLFAPPDNQQREQLHQAMDAINRRYGSLTVSPLRLQQRSSMPDVISPAWKPTGHRKTV